jgi:hypothetical protein
MLATRRARMQPQTPAKRLAKMTKFTRLWRVRRPNDEWRRTAKRHRLQRRGRRERRESRRWGKADSKRYGTPWADDLGPAFAPSTGSGLRRTGRWTGAPVATRSRPAAAGLQPAVEACRRKSGRRGTEGLRDPSTPLRAGSGGRASVGSPRPERRGLAVMPCSSFRVPGSDFRVDQGLQPAPGGHACR